MSTDNKMKGLLKGLRFISQIIFDNNEKQPEIKIGHPTDVRHVAHIGWDGPSETSPPSWMNKFKSVPGGFSSAPLDMNGDIHSQESDNSVDWVSSDSMKRGSRSVNSQSQEDISTKSSKRQSNSNSTGNIRESHAKEKSDKPRQQKRSSSKHTHSNDSFNGSKSTEQSPISIDSDSLQLHGNDLPPIIPENPKRSHSKKTKDAHGVGGSSKSRSKGQHRDPNCNIEGQNSRSSSKSRNKHRNSEEDAPQLERASNGDILINYSN